MNGISFVHTVIMQQHSLTAYNYTKATHVQHQVIIFMVPVQSMKERASSVVRVQPEELEGGQPQRLSREDEVCKRHQAACHQPGIIKPGNENLITFLHP